jgi:hypothetical protein
VKLLVSDRLHQRLKGRTARFRLELAHADFKNQRPHDGIGIGEMF